MPDADLYIISGSPPCWTVMLALEVKELGYNLKRLNNAKGEQKSPEYLAINPRGHVPVLVNGENVVSETLAVLTYLDGIQPTPPIFGETPLETARIWQMISECDGYLRGPVGDISRPLFRGKGDEFADQIVAAAKTVRQELALVETTLDGQDWIAGGKISAADLNIFPVVMQLGRALGRSDASAFDLELYPFATHFPALDDWQRRIEDLPGYDNAYPPHWK